MAITINGTTVTGVTLNGASVNTVTCNGITVFSAMQDYTFPNSSKHFPVNLYDASSTYCGITVSFVNRNSVKNSADKAFDMSNDTFFAGTTGTNSVSATTGVHIVFPFSICVKSVSISNPYKTSGYTNSNKHGLQYGYIYLRANSPNDTASTFATIQGRSVADKVTTSYSAPSSLANSYVKCVSVIGTRWGATDWHSIGRVSITFSARTSDLQAYGLL